MWLEDLMWLVIAPIISVITNLFEVLECVEKCLLLLQYTPPYCLKERKLMNVKYGLNGAGV